MIGTWTKNGWAGSPKKVVMWNTWGVLGNGGGGAGRVARRHTVGSGAEGGAQARVSAR